MGYELHAVIGAAEALLRVPEELRAAQVVELGQGLALAPVTGALFDEVVVCNVGHPTDSALFRS